MAEMYHPSSRFEINLRDDQYSQSFFFMLKDEETANLKV